jgi:chromosome segregation ATPase
MSQELQKLRAALEAERAEHAITRSVLAATQAALDTEAQAHYSTNAELRRLMQANEELKRFRQAHADAVNATLQYMGEVHQLEDKLHAAQAELQAARDARDDAQSARDGALAARDDAVVHAMTL